MAMENKTPGENCGKCRFWTRDKPGGAMGSCLRHGPKAMLLTGPPAVAGGPPLIQTSAYWPPIRSDRWCGDYQPGPQVVN